MSAASRRGLRCDLGQGRACSKCPILGRRQTWGSPAPWRKPPKGQVLFPCHTQEPHGVSGPEPGSAHRGEGGCVSTCAENNGDVSWGPGAPASPGGAPGPPQVQVHCQCWNHDVRCTHLTDTHLRKDSPTCVFDFVRDRKMTFPITCVARLSTRCVLNGGTRKEVTHARPQSPAPSAVCD